MRNLEFSIPGKVKISHHSKQCLGQNLVEKSKQRLLGTYEYRRNASFIQLELKGHLITTASVQTVVGSLSDVVLVFSQVHVFGRTHWIAGYTLICGFCLKSKEPCVQQRKGHTQARKAEGLSPA